MGLDLTLGGLVLLMGIRGWLRGFVLQAIRLGGVISCVYLADPVRDLVKPRVAGHLPTLQPELIDRILWSCSAVASYVVLVGLASLAVKLSRRKTLGEPEPYRNDQFAGFLLGLGKGALVAALVAFAVQKYALDRVKAIPWAEQQARTSRVLVWNERFQPVPKIWAAPPVRHFVQHIQRMGVKDPNASDRPETSPPVATANQPPKLVIPQADRSDFAPDLSRSIETIDEQLRNLGIPAN